MAERYLGRSLGRFRVDELVGAGGFAWVYRGWDPELEIPVAIKVLKPQFAGDSTFEARFRREASTAARLRHPNIIRILGVGREQDAVFFAMDFLPVGLSARLKITATLTDAQVARIGMEVASALAFAHREGVIHRDIKADNILFDDHGNSIVADFGIARALVGYAEQTGTNMVVGTPHYFAPEQARGLQLDGRADIYALGVTLFRASTGELPFQGEDWYEVAKRQIEDEPRAPRTLNPLLSGELEQIILACLAKRPEDRFQSADELRANLAPIAASADVTGEVTTLMSSTSARRASLDWRLKRSRRRVAYAVAAGIAVVASLGLAASLIWSAGSTVEPAADTQVPAERNEDTGSVVARYDSLTRPATHRGTALRIVAPSSARVTINTKDVGQGSWRGEHLEPGVYIVRASVASIPECPSARDSSRLTLVAGQSRTLLLTPRGCATVTLDLGPPGARYSLSPVAGGGGAAGEGGGRGLAGGAKVIEVTAPHARPLVVPAGTYRLRGAAPYCAEYGADSTVRADEALRWRARLFCPDSRE